MDLNRSNTGLEISFLSLFQKIVEQEKLRLYDLEFVPNKSLLRVFIYDEATGTATIDDCVRVDHAMDPYLETENWLPEALTLEVSSPGVYRSLKKADHFQMAAGQRIKLVLVDKLKQLNLGEIPVKLELQSCLVGKLEKVMADEVVIEVEKKRLTIPFDKIRKANLEPKI